MGGGQPTCLAERRFAGAPRIAARRAAGGERVGRRLRRPMANSPEAEEPSRRQCASCGHPLPELGDGAAPARQNLSPQRAAQKIRPRSSFGIRGFLCNRKRFKGRGSKSRSRFYGNSEGALRRLIKLKMRSARCCFGPPRRKRRGEIGRMPKRFRLDARE